MIEKLPEEIEKYSPVQIANLLSCVRTYKKDLESYKEEIGTLYKKEFKHKNYKLSDKLHIQVIDTIFAINIITALEKELEKEQSSTNKITHFFRILNTPQSKKILEIAYMKVSLFCKKQKNCFCLAIEK